MSVIIGCSGGSMLKSVSMDEVLEIEQVAGAQCVDYWLYFNCLQKTDPMYQDDWRCWAEYVRRKVADHGMFIGQTHALFNVTIPEDMHFEEPEEIMYRNIEAARIFNCPNLIFHPVTYNYHIDSFEQRELIMEYNVRWFKMLLGCAKKNGIRILIENTFDFAKVQQGKGDLTIQFSRGCDMLEIVNRIDDPSFGICLDTGHANISNEDIPQMIRSFGKHLYALHLNDNYGLIGPIYEDLHLFPGYGRLPWGDIFKALYEIGYTGIFNLEPVSELPNMDHYSRIRMLATAFDIVRHMAQQAGF
jgi:sugar phosphate isomerase/epimerase